MNLNTKANYCSNCQL